MNKLAHGSTWQLGIQTSVCSFENLKLSDLPCYRAPHMGSIERAVMVILETTQAMN